MSGGDEHVEKKVANTQSSMQQNLKIVTRRLRLADFAEATHDESLESEKLNQPPKKETRIFKADELVTGSNVELSEEELKRVSGGYIGETEKNVK